MPDYDLTSLGSRAFEQMIVALAIAELGPGVGAFGDGADGGREAICDMPIRWANTTIPGQGDASWSGKTVFQAKYNVKPDPSPLQNATWLQYEIGKEIKAWATAKSKGSRDWYPEQIVFVTNVDLSPVAQTGGLDEVDKYIRKRIGPDSIAFKAGLRIRDYRIWHADQVRAMIDAHQSVRWAYPALLSVGDLLSLLRGDQISDRMGRLDLDDPIREEMLRSLRADQWIRLGQAGASGDQKLRVHDVAIDVPAQFEPGSKETASSGRALAAIIKLGDCNLSRREPDPEPRPFVVVVGGPGQGKSTLSQMLVQAYRASLLQGADVGPDAGAIIRGTLDALQRNGLTVPANRRWPIRVDLAKYSEELSTGRDVTLLGWIAAEASKHIEAKLTASNLRSWLGIWPWALILDGLDEVPSFVARTALRQQLDDLVATAEDIAADLLIVITSRPTGDDKFPEDLYRQMTLTDLQANDVVSFGQQLVALRFADDPDMQVRVAERLERASRDGATRHIMRTPLQVTIMSIIVEKSPNLPPSRFTLFDRYYNTILDRESNKEIAIAKFLVQNRLEIDRLHETIGLRLQVLSEESVNAEAILDKSELKRLAVEQLTLRGFDSALAETSSESLVDAATTRLVLLVPQDEGVGFEVRSLGELMAAKALTRGTDQAIAARLAQIARHPHWSNTWLFAIGRLLETDQRFERFVVDELRRVDQSPNNLPSILPAAPSLAARILKDNLSDQRPQFERALIDLVLRELNAPPSYRTIDLADESGAVRHILGTGHWRAVTERLKALMNGDVQRRAAALVLVESLIGRGSVPHEGSLNTIVSPYAFEQWETDLTEDWMRVVHGAKLEATGPVESLGRFLRSAVGALNPSLLEDDRLVSALDGLSHPAFQVTGTEPTIYRPLWVVEAKPEAFAEAMNDPATAETIEAALANVAPAQWPLLSILGYVTESALNRRPVGGSLWSAVDHDNQQAAKY